MKPGDRVKVYNTDAGGRERFEGVAVLVTNTDAADDSPWQRWFVEFESEPGTQYDRVVYPNHKLND